jgi:hypothetical protein
MGRKPYRIKFPQELELPYEVAWGFRSTKEEAA